MNCPSLTNISCKKSFLNVNRVNPHAVILYKTPILDKTCSCAVQVSDIKTIFQKPYIIAIFVVIYTQHPNDPICQNCKRQPLKNNSCYNLLNYSELHICVQFMFLCECQRNIKHKKIPSKLWM